MRARDQDFVMGTQGGAPGYRGRLPVRISRVVIYLVE
ncbi:MAG: hypothetical protein QOF51_4192 [Chloroflexota bacterium]|nr:hypothetical protein [Chloroflexota bacterium]